MLPIFGLMVAREDYPVGGFEVAGAGVYLPAPELGCVMVLFGVLLRSMVMLGWSVAML